MFEAFDRGWQRRVMSITVAKSSSISNPPSKLPKWSIIKHDSPSFTWRSCQFFLIQGIYRGSIDTLHMFGPIFQSFPLSSQGLPMCCPAANDKSVAESTSTWIAWCSAGRETWSWAKVSLEWAPKKIGAAKWGGKGYDVFLISRNRREIFYDPKWSTPGWLGFQPAI